MESVTVKFQPEILQRIDAQIAKHHYNSRTEYIREAVREKLAALTREEAIAGFMALQGKSKVRTTDAENERVREEIGREMLAEYERKFNLAPLDVSRRRHRTGA